MKFLLILAFLSLAVAAVAASGDDDHTLLSATSASQAYPYRLLTRGQAAVVPLVSNLRLTKLTPPANSQNSAQYKITVSFERGCNPDDATTGTSLFPTLHCLYTNAGFQGCTEEGSTVVDGFFVVGQEVYFASSVEVKIVLTRGNRADVSLPVTAVIIDEMYCDGLNAQETVLETVVLKWLQRDYLGTIPYLDPNIVFSANVVAYEYVGIPTVVAYFMLGDPAVSDTFETLSTTRMASASRGNLVTASYLQQIKSLQLPEGSNIYLDDQQHRVYFNKYNQILDHKLFVNTALVFAMYPQGNNPDPNHICTVADTYCTGPLQQYVDHADCLAFLASRPVLKGGPNALAVGVDDVGCRGFHTALVLAYPEGHCFHIGPYDARLSYGAQGIASTPCVDDYPVPGQVPLRALPSQTRSVQERSMHDLRACEADLCRYSLTRKGTSNGALVGTIAFDLMMMETLIPAAGQVVQAYVDASA